MERSLLLFLGLAVVLHMTLSFQVEKESTQETQFQDVAVSDAYLLNLEGSGVEDDIGQAKKVGSAVKHSSAKGRRSEIEQVFFQLMLNHYIYNGTGGYQTLVYDRVESSYPDNIYNEETGRLAFPVSGYFKFDVVCHTFDNYRALLRLMVGGIRVTGAEAIYSATHNYDRHQLTMSVIQHVPQGTEVYVQVYRGNMYGLAYNTRGCTFSGFLLQETVD